jgi:hypothetical protein
MTASALLAFRLARAARRHDAVSSARPFVAAFLSGAVAAGVRVFFHGLRIVAPAAVLGALCGWSRPGSPPQACCWVSPACGAPRNGPTSWRGLPGSGRLRSLPMPSATISSPFPASTFSQTSQFLRLWGYVRPCAGSRARPGSCRASARRSSPPEPRPLAIATERPGITTTPSTCFRSPLSGASIVRPRELPAPEADAMARGLRGGPATRDAPRPPPARTRSESPRVAAGESPQPA